MDFVLIWKPALELSYVDNRRKEKYLHQVCKEIFSRFLDEEEKIDLIFWTVLFVSGVTDVEEISLV